MEEVTLHPPRLTEIGAAAGTLAIPLFALLALLTGSVATAVAGCGLGALLLVGSLVAGRTEQYSVREVFVSGSIS